MRDLSPARLRALIKSASTPDHIVPARHGITTPEAEDQMVELGYWARIEDDEVRGVMCRRYRMTDLGMQRTGR